MTRSSLLIVENGLTFPGPRLRSRGSGSAAPAARLPEPRVVGSWVHRHLGRLRSGPGSSRLARRRLCSLPCPIRAGSPRWVLIVEAVPELDVHGTRKLGKDDGVRSARCEPAVVAGSGLVVAAVRGSCTVPLGAANGSVPAVASVGLETGWPQDPTGGRRERYWAADYFGHQLRFDSTPVGSPSAGGLCDTDDVVVAPDGTLIATCAGEGTVVRVQRDGAVWRPSRRRSRRQPVALEPGGERSSSASVHRRHPDCLRCRSTAGRSRWSPMACPSSTGFGGPDGRLRADRGVEALLGSTGGLMRDQHWRRGRPRGHPLRSTSRVGRAGLRRRCRHSVPTGPSTSAQASTWRSQSTH